MTAEIKKILSSKSCSPIFLTFQNDWVQKKEILKKFEDFYRAVF